MHIDQKQKGDSYESQDVRMTGEKINESVRVMLLETHWSLSASTRKYHGTQISATLQFLRLFVI